jgi:gamma-tubulin complex component 2
MSLLSALCLSLETDELPPVEEGSDDEDDGLGGMAEELGLGGAGLKGLIKNLKAAQEGAVDAGGPILGGEVLGIICEREATMSG